MQSHCARWSQIQKCQRLVELGWLTATSPNISDVLYEVKLFRPDRGRDPVLPAPGWRVSVLLSHLADEARERALRRLYKIARQKDTPQIRGLRLLRSWLSPHQRAQFDAFGYFDVIGGASGKKYRIYFGTSANIQELGEDGVPRAGWCVVPLGNLVPGDVMLAQKIALEASEYATLAVANKLPPLPGNWRRDLRRPF
jgi:hypothetical protein